MLLENRLVGKSVLIFVVNTLFPTVIAHFITLWSIFLRNSTMNDIF